MAPFTPASTEQYRIIAMMLLKSTLSALLLANATFAAEPMVFQARTTHSGNWSDVETWEGGRQPQSGDFVQVRTGHTIVYDADSSDALRMIHVAGTLTFSREKSTLLVVGLLKIEPGETTIEDGFDCHDEPGDRPTLPIGVSQPALEIGTRASPIPAGVKATIRLRHFAGTNSEVLPAIICCGGRWDVHGAPLNRTWLKLAAEAKPGDSRVTLEQPVSDWGVGDRVIITTGVLSGPELGATFRRTGGRPKPVGTEERVIAGIDGVTLALDRPLDKAHCAQEGMRCEIANLSRNVVIESAEPKGPRGHTMYHHDSTGGISYAEFRHLGKEGVLGKYAIHFHLVRGTMRGSGVTGASIWDSHNRWITIHGTDHLLIRDCVGYQSRGHGFFLEDATEQWNVLDRNLAVQAFSNAPLPKQVLPYDPNDGAGFWWANGRNTFTRNVACENDRYGYHFQITKTPEFDPLLSLCESDGRIVKRDVRTVPFLRFEDNESHGEGLFSFRFGDEAHGTVHGDREHPFIARNLHAWEAHYALRPNVQCFLLEGLRVQNAAYGIYHPDYDAHVYRHIEFDNVTAEPINGGHDEQSLPYGNFTYDRLTFKNCQLGRDPLIQLTAIGPKPGLVGHFRGITLINSTSKGSGVVDFGGGPSTNRIDNPVSYYFFDVPSPGVVSGVQSVKFPATVKDSQMMGPFARAGVIKGVTFPQLLAPVDDLPPATLITSIKRAGDKRIVHGVAHDNGEIREVTVNGHSAQIVAQHAGVADWIISLDAPPDGRYIAQSTDDAGNAELMPHDLRQYSAHLSAALPQ
jgi:G8 domain-containing protein